MRDFLGRVRWFRMFVLLCGLVGAYGLVGWPGPLLVLFVWVEFTGP